MRLNVARLATFSLLLWACDVPVLGLTPTGIGAAAATDGGSCGRGFLVAQSDYSSSNFSAYAPDGSLLSPSLGSSNVASAGLVQAFSGDTVFPTTKALGKEFVVIDRYPQSVLSYVDLSTAKVRAQLDVSSGFAANPHDYLELDAHRALVSRFDKNRRTGIAPTDTGADLLIVDPTVPAVVGSLALGGSLPKETPSLTAHPDRLLLVGNRVLVVVSLYGSNYRTSGPAYVVVFDRTSLQRLGAVEIDGVQGCSGIAVAPSHSEVAVACSGQWGDPTGASPESSAIVGLSVSDHPTEVWRVSASSLEAPAAFGFALDYAQDNLVLFTKLGRVAASGEIQNSDQLLVIDTVRGRVRSLLETKNEAFVLGDVRCLEGCGKCGVARAGRDPALLIWQVSTDRLVPFASARMQDGTGLPPRWLGTF